MTQATCWLDEGILDGRLSDMPTPGEVSNCWMSTRAKLLIAIWGSQSSSVRSRKGPAGRPADGRHLA